VPDGTGSYEVTTPHPVSAQRAPQRTDRQIRTKTRSQPIIGSGRPLRATCSFSLSILWFAVIALISFSLTLSCLLKDQAMAASRHDATLKNGAPSYTTPVDSTFICPPFAPASIPGGCSGWLGAVVARPHPECTRRA
jgi:hypothetical protein